MKDLSARKLVGAREYYLEDMEERPLSQLWNVSNLKKHNH